jgi:transposase InsO family protein
VDQSLSRKGKCGDNAVAESFFKSLKKDRVYKNYNNVYSYVEISIFK